MWDLPSSSSYLSSLCICCDEHTASIAPLRAFNLVNSLNSLQRARGQKDMRKRKAESFLFCLLSCFSLSFPTWAILFSLGSHPCRVCLHFTSWWDASYHLKLPSLVPFGFLLTNSRIYVRKLSMCTGQFWAGVCHFARNEAHIHTRLKKTSVLHQLLHFCQPTWNVR